MLEKILQKYFDLKEIYNEEDWNNSYDKLVQLIYDLEDLGVIDSNNRIVDNLDSIHNIEC